jgi:type III restriction enzyme
MTENVSAANEIADYLDSDTFPLLKGHVLNIHTRLKGRIKTVRRSGREIKEFVESEAGMKPDDLRALREMSRELDKRDSKHRCVVSVMMLREGWDVRNVTTIVPLRPYSAKSGILPEQTLGRGLRRMFPLGDTPEMVTVVHHPAFRKLYEDELAQEGLDIAVLPIREAFKQTVTIFVDHGKKSVEDLEIEIPFISDAVETTAELPGLTFDEVKRSFQRQYRPLPIGKKKEGPIEYKERHLFTDEIVARMQLDAGLLTTAWSAAGYFAQMLGRAGRVSNPHQVLTPLIEEFLSTVLFEREVDLYSGEVDHRMRDLDVLEHVRATFTPLILSKTVQKKERKRVSQGVRLSTWKPYQATSTVNRPAVPGQRTMFNLVPCENEFEQAFADFCDFASDVAAFAKNAGPQKLMIDYLRPDGHRALYVPDFFVRLKDGNSLLCELKGKEDALVPVKARAAGEWCKAASKGQGKWRYLYVPYLLFQQSSAGTMMELLRACEPSLKTLIQEAETGQQELPLLEATAQKQADDLFARVLQQAGIAKAPAAVEGAMRQAVLLLDHAVRAGMPDYGHAFQPLLYPLDEYALRILDSRLSPRIPADTQEREDYFNPTLIVLRSRERALLEKHGRYLRDNLVFGRSIMKVVPLQG